MEAEVHDDFRGRVGSWQRAIDALEHVAAVGIEPYLNITVGHYNALSDDVENMLKYSKSKGYTTLVNVATPGGLWKNVTEVMVDDKDKEHLINKRKEYGNVLRNLWNPFDPENEKVIGCNTVNRLYITPLGDVLVCPYVHIKIGNIYENSLKEDQIDSLIDQVKLFLNDQSDKNSFIKDYNDWVKERIQYEK